MSRPGKLKLLNAICVGLSDSHQRNPVYDSDTDFLFCSCLPVYPLNNIIIGGIAFGINSGAYVAEIVRSGYYVY